MKKDNFFFYSRVQLASIPENVSIICVFLLGIILMVMKARKQKMFLLNQHLVFLPNMEDSKLQLIVFDKWASVLNILFKVNLKLISCYIKSCQIELQRYTIARTQIQPKAFAYLDQYQKIQYFYDSVYQQYFLYNFNIIPKSNNYIVFSSVCMPKFIEALLHAGTTNNQDYDYGYIPYILALASSILWPLGWIYSNEHNLPMCQSTMIRGISTLIFNYILCRVYNCGIVFADRTTFSLLVFRSLIIGATSLAIGFSQFILPLSIAHTIISSSTLFVFLIDYFVNKININLKQGLGIAIGVIGMLLAANGRVLSLWMDTTYQQKSQFTYITQDLRLIMIFTVLFILVIAIWSYGFVVTKNLNYNAFQVNFFLGIVNIFMGAIVYQILPLNPSSNPDSIIPSKQNFYWGIVFTGVPLVFDQCFLILALLMCKQSGVIIMSSYNSTIVGYLISVFRYKERPSMFVNLGVLLLAIGLYQTIFNSSIHQKISNESERKEYEQKDNNIDMQNKDNKQNKNIIKNEKQKFQCS